MQRASKYLTEKLPNSQSWLQMAFLSTTTNADTHPCLSDRLRAIAAAPEPERNYSQRALQPPPTSAALLLLGDSLNEARTGAQEVWRKECAEEWSQQHRKSAALQHRLGGIEQATARAALDADALWDKAQVVSQLEGSQAAVPLLRQILAAQPRHGWANFALGCILLDADDAQGGACLETAFAEDEEFLPNAANALHGYFKRHGQADQIRELYARLDQHEKSVRAGAEERQNVSASDTLIAHDLDAGQLGHLQNDLAAHGEIEIARLARKSLKFFSKQRFYLLCIELRKPWHRMPNTTREQTVVAELIKTVKLPGRVLIFPPRRGMRPIARKIKAMPDLIVYQLLK